LIVYRDDGGGTATDPSLSLAECRSRTLALLAGGRPSHDDVMTLLIELGVLEAAVADALFPESDGLSPLADAFRGASSAAGRLFRLSWHESRTAELLRNAEALAALLDDIGRGPLPAVVRPKVPEGYAYYALYPETYLAAAERWATEAGAGRAVVIGLRSIGASLAAVVAAGVDGAGVPVASVTLRPRGHPFDRRPVLTEALATGLRARAGDAHFLVVDEGPGLSGSSLTGTAAVLAELGVPDRRIVLFPSHQPDPLGFVSRSARDRWPRHEKAWAPFETAFPEGPPWGAKARDLSAGGWRGVLYADERAWPAVHPWHERRKYLAGDVEAGSAVLHKFAGLGSHGARAHARAVALAEAGFAPPALGLARGFLRQAWIDGRPLGRRDAGSSFLSATGAYLAHLVRDHVTGDLAGAGPLVEMLRANVAEGLGSAWVDRLAGLERHVAAFGEVPALAVDGRMLPHEWLVTPAGRYLKADGVDHHADHLFPGPADIAWDLAGLADEFGLDEAVVGDLGATLGTALGDAGLLARLPFHRAAYIAFRLGYVRLAASTLAGTADRARMGRLARRYGWQLRRAVERLSAVL
jgi:hypothetical protein